MIFFDRNNGNTPHRIQMAKKNQMDHHVPNNHTMAVTINHTVDADDNENGVTETQRKQMNSKQVAQVHVHEQNLLLAPNHNKETNNI